jgi:Helix-turn-helix domain
MAQMAGFLSRFARIGRESRHRPDAVRQRSPPDTRHHPDSRLANRSRLLDRLLVQDGLTLSELEAELAMTRFGVMKYLRILEQAQLIVTRRSGRKKHHFSSVVPLRLLRDRWIDKYTQRRVSALTDLGAPLEPSAKLEKSA